MNTRSSVANAANTPEEQACNFLLIAKVMGQLVRELFSLLRSRIIQCFAKFFNILSLRWKNTFNFL
jgi:hypothetical protein